MFAQVLIEYKVKSLDKTFTYKINAKMRNKIQVGMKVKVPFANSYLNGIVVNITKEADNVDNIKEILTIVDEDFYLNKELLEMGKYLKEKTLCSLITAYQTMLPPSLKVKNQSREYQLYDTFIILNPDIDVNEYIKNNPRCKKQKEIIELLQKEKKLLKKDLNSPSLRILLEKNIVQEHKEVKYRINIKNNTILDHALNNEQEKVYEQIIKYLNQSKTFLLYGVTGSGKTEIYIHLIRKVIEQNQRALLLVPEITLSTQIIKNFYERFGNKVAIFHSALSDGEKYDEYKKIYNNEVDIVVGTRSAVFAPINNLGLIIIDEEHSENYKQENNPRYHTLDLALFRSKYNKIPLVLGSATPSLDSMARAQKKVFQLLELKNRFGDSQMPKVSIINMLDEMKQRNMYLSKDLQLKIKNRLAKKEQVILLLNRRGHSTIITCQNCGFTYKCPYCDISLTYHKSTNNLRCHYCGYTVFKSNQCPQCHEESLNFFGLGTEKLELELNKLFSGARIVRMDVDTTSRKGSHEKILQDFRNNQYDILLGTQMISKGLDFPNVTLVGIINADLTLNMPDFKAKERTFSLLTQTAGRSGRSNKSGEVIIQTFNPDELIYSFVVHNDYLAFYKYEMLNRRQLKYPPYYYLTSIKVLSRYYEEASKEANKVANYLKKYLDKETIVLGPTTANIFRINNVYRFQIIIKYKFDKYLNKVIYDLDQLYILNKKVYLEIDMNPNFI